MPVTSLIEIDFSYTRSRKVIVDEIVTVPLGNLIAWRLVDKTSIRDRERYSYLHFRFYFPGSSPFSWKEKQFYTDGIPRPRNLNSFDNDPLIFEAEPAEQPGDFKYGIEVITSGGQIYDEDPIIRIKNL